MRSSILSKLVTVFGLALILSLLHWGAWEMVREVAGRYIFHIFDLVGFSVSVTPGTTARPFGFDSSTIEFVASLVSTAFILSFIVPALVIVQWRNPFQTLAVSTITEEWIQALFDAVNHAAFSPDGSRIVTAFAGDRDASQARSAAWVRRGLAGKFPLKPARRSADQGAKVCNWVIPCSKITVRTPKRPRPD